MDKRIVHIALMMLVQLGFANAQLYHFNKVIDLPRVHEEPYYTFANARYGAMVDSQFILMVRIFDSLDHEIYGIEKMAMVSIDNKGNYIGRKLLIDRNNQHRSSYTIEKGFEYNENERVLYFYGHYYSTTEERGIRSLFTYDLETHTIIKRAEIPNPEGKEARLINYVFTYDSVYSEIYMVGQSYYRFDLDRPQKEILSIVDTSLTIKQQISVEPIPFEGLVGNYGGLHLQRTPDGNLVFLSGNRYNYEGTRDLAKYVLRKMVFNDSLEIIEDVLYDKMPNVRKFTDQYNAVLLANGDWLLYLDHKSLGIDNPHFHPIAIRMKEDFSDVVWTHEPHIVLPIEEHKSFSRSFCVNSDTTAMLTVINAFTSEVTAWINKIDIESGRDLWAQQVKALVPDGLKVVREEFHHIMPTPVGGYLITGEIWIEREFEDEGIINIPEIWLIHMDEDGCFLPECDSVVMTTEDYVENELEFLLYPNPSSDLMILQLPKDAKDIANEGLISIYDDQGHSVLQYDLDLMGQTQYILPVDKLGTGNFVATIRLGKYALSQKIQIVK